MNSYSSYKILPEQKLILTNFEGEIEMRDIIKINIEFLGDPLYDPRFDVIMDFTNSMAIGFKVDLMDYIEFFKKNVRLPERIKVGIVVSTPNQEFLVSLYKPIAALMKMDVGKFRRMVDCFKWMKMEDTTKALVFSELNSIKVGVK